jgi:hypothetical protein
MITFFDYLLVCGVDRRTGLSNFILFIKTIFTRISISITHITVISRPRAAFGCRPSVRWSPVTPLCGLWPYEARPRRRDLGAAPPPISRQSNRHRKYIAPAARSRRQTFRRRAKLGRRPINRRRISGVRLDQNVQVIGRRFGHPALSAAGY